MEKITAEDMNHIPIIDTHIHLWDARQLRMPWLSRIDKFQERYTLDDYQQAISGLNIIASCYQEVDVVKEDQLKEVAMITPLCADPTKRLVSIAAGIDLSSMNCPSVLETYARNAFIKAIRHTLFFEDPSICVDQTFLANTRLLSRFGFVCDISIPAQHIHHTVEWVRQCPDTVFVIDHCGLMPPQSEDESLWNHWKTGMRNYAACHNTICKISSFDFLADHPMEWDQLQPIIRFCLEIFGWERVIFATNWPVCNINSSAARWLETLKKILSQESTENLHRLFFDNAMRYYRI